MGLTGIGRSKAEGAMSGFAKTSELEAQRNQTNDTLEANFEAAEQSQKGTLASTGAMVGLAAAGGMSAGLAALGPVGLGIAGGLLVASLF